MSTWREFAARLVPWVHPGMAALVRRADGRGSASVEGHLRICARCREQAALLAEAVAQTPAGSPVLDDVFENLDLRMQAWCSLAGIEIGKHTRDGTAVSRELAGALELYFGTETARRIQSCGGGSASTRRLAPVTKPLFAAFLGQKAAESLASRIASAIT